MRPSHPSTPSPPARGRSFAPCSQTAAASDGSPPTAASTSGNQDEAIACRRLPDAGIGPGTAFPEPAELPGRACGCGPPPAAGRDQSLIFCGWRDPGPGTRPRGLGTRYRSVLGGLGAARNLARLRHVVQARDPVPAYSLTLSRSLFSAMNPLISSLIASSFSHCPLYSVTGNRPRP